jgi:predicted TPR repeat methyltransferase
MVERARARGVYDRLVRADAVQFLAGSAERFDLVVAADVLIYLGDPAPLFAAAQRAMVSNGLLAFTVELAGGGDTDPGDAGQAPQDDPGWRLLPSLRYTQSRPHLLRLAQAHGFEPLIVDAAPVRFDQGQAVDGLYLVLRRAASTEPR